MQGYLFWIFRILAMKYAILLVTSVLKKVIIMKLLERYIVSLTNLYGVVHQDKVIEIYNEQNEEQIELADILRVNNEAIAKKFAYKEGDYFAHESVLEFDEMEKELAEKKGKPFYVPPRNQLLR